MPDGEVEPVSAAALSLAVIPGAGRFYNSQPIKGMAHLVLLPFLLLWVLAPILSVTGESWIAGVLLVGLWAYSAIDAWTRARKINAIRRTNS